jgi:DNA-binding CsgD family transcriptional regulator/tetratricopeptide (TPR) repeat protein
LRRVLGYLDETADRKLLCRAQERLSYFLNDLGEDAAAVAAGQAAVDALPPDPPTWEYARALATHAHALLAFADHDAVRARAEQARTAALAAGAPWVEADALVTLGIISERSGKVADAVAMFSTAHRQATEARVLGVELRATYQLARLQLEQGDLDGAARRAHEGTERANGAGLGLAQYGLDLQYLHYLAHFADGSWDDAQEIADGFPVRVTSPAEARLSAMALFVAVGRGLDVVEERRVWLEPMFARDGFVEYIARGLFAERALWRGDTATAIAEIQETIRAIEEIDEGYRSPQLIRVAAVGLGALADEVGAARITADSERLERILEQADELLQIARDGAANRRMPGFALGVDGRGWLARAEAERGRANGENSPAAWQAVVDTFGEDFVYETARARWRLAEALAEAGDRETAGCVWLLAKQAADTLRAAPLQTALADLGRRARIGTAERDPGFGGRRPLAGLTEREREVLVLLASGHSNKEIGTELFISPKTVSVHVSNILGKLGAASRTEAAAIAHREGLSLSAGDVGDDREAG